LYPVKMCASLLQLNFPRRSRTARSFVAAVRQEAADRAVGSVEAGVLSLRTLTAGQSTAYSWCVGWPGKFAVSNIPAPTVACCVG